MIRPIFVDPDGVCWVILSRGAAAKIDVTDAEAVGRFNWHLTSGGYAARTVARQTVFLHNFLSKPKSGSVVDHINGNKLDCRRINLRIGTASQNKKNRKRQPNASGVKGVDWRATHKKWRARIRCETKLFHLGYFNSAADAEQAYEKAAQELFGEFKRLKTHYS